MSNQEEDDVQDAINKLEIAIRTQVERSLNVTDVRVSTQRSRFYKAWCFAIYGHLLGPSGICLRCQKKIGIVNVPKDKTK